MGVDAEYGKLVTGRRPTAHPSTAPTERPYIPGSRHRRHGDPHHRDRPPRKWFETYPQMSEGSIAVTNRVSAVLWRLGIFVLVSANSLLTVYIGIELMSLSLYAMVAFDRENGVAAESAMKYFVLGAIAALKADPELRRLPVIVLTTSKSQHEINRCYELGAAAVLNKPMRLRSSVLLTCTAASHWRISAHAACAAG